MSRDLAMMGPVECGHGWHDGMVGWRRVVATGVSIEVATRRSGVHKAAGVVWRGSQSPAPAGQAIEVPALATRRAPRAQGYGPNLPRLPKSTLSRTCQYANPPIGGGGVQLLNSSAPMPTRCRDGGLDARRLGG
jgi:hypothetical protein